MSWQHELWLTSWWSEEFNYEFIESTENCYFVFALDSVWIRGVFMGGEVHVCVCVCMWASECVCMWEREIERGERERRGGLKLMVATVTCRNIPPVKSKQYMYKKSWGLVYIHVHVYSTPTSQTLIDIIQDASQVHMLEFHSAGQHNIKGMHFTNQHSFHVQCLQHPWHSSAEIG